MKSLASVIVPCWNQLEFTRHCIAALRRHTREPWELVVIDNGSTDGTRDYLAGVQDMSPVPVRVVANARNLGFPAAINQGLRRARGEYLVLLNNDVVVTEGWLDHLVALASASTEGIGPGIAGKMGAGLDLTVIDFNELRSGDGEACASPPLPPLRKGGKRNASGGQDMQGGDRSNVRRSRCTSCFDDWAGWAYVELCRAAAVGRGGAVL